MRDRERRREGGWGVGETDPPRLLLSLFIPLLTAPLVGCRSHASAEDCAEITAHYLDLAVKESPGAASMSPAQAAAVRDVERGLKRAEPSYRFVQDRCEAVTRAEVSCARDAASTRAWEACVHPAEAR